MADIENLDELDSWGQGEPKAQVEGQELVSGSTLAALCHLRDRTLQKNRIGFGNRLAAIQSGRDTADADTLTVIEEWFFVFQDLEKRVDDDIKRLVEDIPIVQEMVRVKGLGAILAAKVVAAVDIERADTVSALWRYAGYAVIAGQRERPTKGERLHYNAELKRNLYLIALSFLRSNSPYRAVYDAAREHYEQTHPDWTKGHAHNAALRKMMKIFLSHLWEVWRNLEGLPVREPYVLDQLGHTHKYDRSDFGWKV